jgi:hypothetical protein
MMWKIPHHWTMSRLVPLILAAAFLFGVWQLWRSGGVRTGPGIIAAGAPDQVALPAAAAIRKDEFTLNPVARITWRARVLSVESYRWDAASGLSPVDIALGWDRMSDETVLASLAISQGQRFFTYRYQQPPIPKDEIERSAANVHMIPASSAIRRALTGARPGELIEFEGYLVNVTGPNGFYWYTSTVRTDTGPGACEIVYVKQVSVRRA